LRPCAISAKGAQGLMQLMPDTAQQLAVLDVFDPKENIEAGAKYLKQLIDKYKGDLKLALGAYNAGPTTVDQAGGIPDIQETKDYVEAILKRLAK
jgi:soluble lytic murein transglycosylase-like protein